MNTHQVRPDPEQTPADTKEAKAQTSYWGKLVELTNHRLLVLVIAGLCGILWANFVVRPATILEEQKTKVVKFEEFQKHTNEFKTEIKQEVITLRGETKQLYEANQQLKGDVRFLDAFRKDAQRLSEELATDRQSYSQASTALQKTNAELNESLIAIEKRLVSAEEKLAALDDIEKGLRETRADVAKINTGQSGFSTELRLPIGPRTIVKGDKGTSEGRDAFLVYGINDLPVIAPEDILRARVTRAVLLNKDNEVVPNVIAGGRIDEIAEALSVRVVFGRDVKSPEDLLREGQSLLITLSWPDSPR